MLISLVLLQKHRNSPFCGFVLCYLENAMFENVKCVGDLGLFVSAVSGFVICMLANGLECLLTAVAAAPQWLSSIIWAIVC